MDKKIPTLSELHTFSPLKINKTAITLYQNNVTLEKPYNFKNRNTLIGIEIEVENIKDPIDPISPFWKCAEDNSLRNYGQEFISVPLRASSIPYAIEYLKRNLFSTNEPIFSNRTSVHIHLNVRDFTLERLKVFLLLYCIFEKHFFNIAGSRRESNIFCIPLYKSEQKIHLSQYENTLTNWNKYNALNLGCILGNGINSNLGTIEFRHLYGTLDTTILYPWIDSIIHLREYSRLIPLENLVEILKNLNTTSEYISLYKKVFEKTCLNLNLISKLDFESCITQTKLNYFEYDNCCNNNPSTLDSNFNKDKPKPQKLDFPSFDSSKKYVESVLNTIYHNSAISTSPTFSSTTESS